MTRPHSTIYIRALVAGLELVQTHTGLQRCLLYTGAMSSTAVHNSTFCLIATPCHAMSPCQMLQLNKLEIPLVHTQAGLQLGDTSCHA